MDTNARSIKLQGIVESIKNGHPQELVSVREVIGWFGALRRGANVNWTVRRELEKLGLDTTPDFEGSHIDGYIQFVLKQEPVDALGAGAAAIAPNEVADLEQQAAQAAAVYVGGAGVEPAYRVSRLLDPKLRLVSIGPDATVEEASTLMLRHDYSQLPVMTNDRDIRGVISWDSIGPAMVLKRPAPLLVREVMRPHVEVKTTDSIFQVINLIIDSSYVLARNERKEVVGILTTTDLSQQFQDLAEPFLLIGEIESHIRALIDGRFTKVELQAARNENDPDRAVDSVADLTLGEHLRLIQSQAHWDRLRILANRAVFVKEFDEIRRLRNDVMHFDSDRITDTERTSLRRFVNFLHQLKDHQPPPAA